MLGVVEAQDVAEALEVTVASEVPVTRGVCEDELVPLLRAESLGELVSLGDTVELPVLQGEGELLGVGVELAVPRALPVSVALPVRAMEPEGEEEVDTVPDRLLMALPVLLTLRVERGETLVLGQGLEENDLRGDELRLGDMLEDPEVQGEGVVLRVTARLCVEDADTLTEEESEEEALLERLALAEAVSLLEGEWQGLALRDTEGEGDWEEEKEGELDAVVEGDLSSVKEMLGEEEEEGLARLLGVAVGQLDTDGLPGAVSDT